MMRTTLKYIARELSLIFRKHSDFHYKIDAIIDNCSHYYFPEKFDAFYPDTNTKVGVEKSPFKRFVRKRNFWNKLVKAHNLKELESAYDMFADENSKEIFLMVMMYKLSKTPVLRFPLFYSKIFDELPKLQKLAIDEEKIPVWGGIFSLQKFDLSPIGYDLKLWAAGPEGIIVDFLLDQYRYKNIVRIEENDNIIDGGGCYGDTALYFASQTKGEIHSFEFMRENLEILQKNMELTPQYKTKIKIVQRPLSDVSGKKLYAIDNGPGTTLTEHDQPGATEYLTITIDDYVKENNVDKIDFIKLDVEGCEAATLRGARETIRNHKPKLAVCAYHKIEDLTVLPKLIKDINPEYKLYFEQNNISQNEAVIFAKVLE